MFKFIILLNVVLTIISTSTNQGLYQSISTLDDNMKFSIWANYNNKDYDSNQKLRDEKYENFIENMKYIENHNKLNQQRGYSLGLGPFSDMSFDEFYKRFNNPELKKPTLKDKEDIEYVSGYKISGKKDWSSYFSIKDGSSCTSGADSVTSLIEFKLKTEYKIQTQISSQSFIDCHSSGCKPTESQSIVSFFKGGAYKETDYNYTGEKGICKFHKQSSTNKCDYVLPYVEIVDYTRKRRNKKNFEETINNEPFLIDVPLNKLIQNYHKGILDMDTTVNDEAGVNIPMIVVEITEDYFKLLPSFGKKYGENGFIRIKYSSSDNQYDLIFGRYDLITITKLKIN